MEKDSRPATARGLPTAAHNGFADGAWTAREWERILFSPGGQSGRQTGPDKATPTLAGQRSKSLILSLGRLAVAAIREVCSVMACVGAHVVFLERYLRTNARCPLRGSGCWCPAR